MSEEKNYLDETILEMKNLKNKEVLIPLQEVTE